MAPVPPYHGAVPAATARDPPAAARTWRRRSVRAWWRFPGRGNANAISYMHFIQIAW